MYNKIDRLDRRPRVNHNRSCAGRAVWLSAVTGEGLPLLLQAIADRLRRKTVTGTIRLGPEQARQRALLFELGAVMREVADDDGGWQLDISVAETDFRRFLKQNGLDRDIFVQPPASSPARAATQR